MAIIKDFLTPFGVTATYHKIVKAEFNINNLELEIVVAIFTTAAARLDGKNPLWHEYVRIPFSALTVDPRDLLYVLAQNYGPSYLKDGNADVPTVVTAPELTLTVEALIVPPPFVPPVVFDVSVPNNIRTLVEDLTQAQSDALYARNTSNDIAIVAASATQAAVDAEAIYAADGLGTSATTAANARAAADAANTLAASALQRAVDAEAALAVAQAAYDAGINPPVTP